MSIELTNYTIYTYRTGHYSYEANEVSFSASFNSYYFTAACGNNSSLDSNNKSSDSDSDSGKDGYKPKELTVQFVPSQNADTLEAKAKPLEKLLSEKLDIPVKVSVSTNYNTIVEAMKSKK